MNRAKLESESIPILLGVFTFPRAIVDYIREFLDAFQLIKLQQVHIRLRVHQNVILDGLNTDAGSNPGRGIPLSRIPYSLRVSSWLRQWSYWCHPPRTAPHKDTPIPSHTPGLSNRAYPIDERSGAKPSSTHALLQQGFIVGRIHQVHRLRH